MRKSIALSLFFFLLALDTQATRAQVLYGSIVGTITDQSGAVVPAADVKAVNPQTGETRDVTADDAGRYTIGNVMPGNYQIRVQRPGFRQVTTSGVTATINTVTRIDVQMQLGSQTQEVNVSGSAATLANR